MILHYVTLRCVTLRYVPLHCIVLYYIILHSLLSSLCHILSASPLGTGPVPFHYFSGSRPVQLAHPTSGVGASGGGGPWLMHSNPFPLASSNHSGFSKRS